MWPFGKDARLRQEFARAATESVSRDRPELAVRVSRGEFTLEGATVECDLESWFSQWQKSGVNRHLVLVELTTSLRRATAKPRKAASLVELVPPEVGTIAAFDEIDRVGQLLLENGEELRFGATACKGFELSLGAQIFVTEVGEHRLGGRKATKLRQTSKSEGELRAEADVQAANQAKEAERERDEKREQARPTTTHEAIVARIKAAVMPDEDDDADEAQLCELTGDLELMEPTLGHVEAILRGVAESPPMAHFGDPGPLVHYIEGFSANGYEEALFKISKAHPTSHFLWMLERCAGAEDDYAATALEIIRSYATHPDTPNGLRDQVAEYADDGS